MQPEELLTLFFTCCRVRDEKAVSVISALSPEQWERLVRFAQARDVGPYLYAKLSENRLISLAPAGVEPGLKKIYFANAALNISIRQQLAEILKALNEAGIPVIPLKGVYLSAKIYKNPADRTMVDLDILVREEDILETVQVMRSLGYETPYHFWESPGHHLPPFRKPGMLLPVEVHWRLVMPKKMDSIDNTHIWESARPISLGGNPCFELSPTHRLVHACQHATTHLFSNAIRAICDIDVLIQFYGDKLDWPEFLSILDLIGGTRGAFLVLHFAHQFLNTPLPLAVEQGLAENPLPPIVLDCAISSMSNGREFPDAPPVGAMNMLQWWIGKTKKIVSEARFDLTRTGNMAQLSTAGSLANRLAYVFRANLGAVVQLRHRITPDDGMKKQQYLRNWLGLR